jgi:hypothetical protein
MPMIYRSMVPDGGKPRIGDQADCLGVRLPPSENADIRVLPGSLVRPEGGGMSVAPEWRKLPPHRIPRRLQHLTLQATGKNRLVCWKMGNGPEWRGL